MKLKTRRILTLIALLFILGVLLAVGYAIWKWSAGVWQAFGATALLMAGGSLVLAGLIVLPFGVSLHLGDKRSMIAARAYIDSLAKTPVLDTYKITQIDDPDIHTWTPWKQENGKFSVVPFRKDGLIMWDLRVARDLDSDEAWEIANIGRRKLGWIRPATSTTE